ncbi:ABC transporter substrate-binding protein [Flavobacteriaceae bacterium R38]|nr:ABC transporter substrate-binding protein [Flavobacteriaceae bacterium R38]
MIVIKDQLQRILEISRTPKRIISLVPSQTELLCDMGLEDAIVGVTKFCVHPSHLKSAKTIVGGTKQIKIEKIKELRPDIVLCNKEENTKEIVEELEKIVPVHVSDIYTIDDSLELIKSYGEIFDCIDKSSEIINKITVNLADFKGFIKNQPNYRTAYFIWREPWMVTAGTTFINHLLKLNGFENVYSDEKRYPEVNIKKMKEESDPELVLLSSEPFPFKEKHVSEVEKYLPDSKVILVDGEYFSWYGSRLINAFQYFKQLRLNL